MATPSDVLRVAAGQLGYCRYDDPEAGTKYGRWYAGRTGSPAFGASGVPFCAMGVSWALDQVGMTPPGGIVAYVPYAINNAKSAGRLVGARDAAPGDLVCFDWDGDGLADHIGFVELNRGTYVQTIEFNTVGADGRDGSVARRTRAWDAVCAMIRPDYAGAAPVPADAGQATGFQTIPDGWWGKNTSRDLQRAQGTTVDGVVSSQPAYWAASMPGCTTGWERVADAQAQGSQLIASMQRPMGIDSDGKAGRDFINHLEARYGYTPDGHLDAPSNTIRSMQLALARAGHF